MSYPPSDEDKIRKMFFGFCKTVLKNALSNYYRHETPYYAHESLVTDDKAFFDLRLTASNPYPSDYHVLQVDAFTAQIEDDRLYRSIKQLTENQQIVIILYYWYDLTEEEIAIQLKIPRPTIHYRKSQALRQLKKHLVKENPEHGIEPCHHSKRHTRKH